MAKLKTYTFGTNNWNPDADLSKAFFDSLNCPLLNTTLVNEYDFTIQFDNSIILKSYGYGSPGAHISLIDHGKEIYIMDYYGAYGSKTYTVIYTNSMFFFYYSGNYGSSELKFVFVFEKIEDQKIYGISSGSGSNVSNIIYEDYITRTKYQKDMPILDYSVTSGILDYIDHDIFFSYHYGEQQNPEMIKKVLNDPHMFHTTALTPKQIITFGGKNYYVLGPNSIIEVED